MIAVNGCMSFTAKLTDFINLELPSRYSSKAFSRSWSSWRISSGEFDCSRATAKGVLERSVPVIFAYSAKAASMMNWTLEVEDVRCAIDDMEKMDVCTFLCSKSERKELWEGEQGTRWNQSTGELGSYNVTECDKCTVHMYK